MLIFPVACLWKHILEHNRGPYTDESLSKHFQGMKIMLMSWCNEKQYDVLDKKIPILTLSHKSFTLDAVIRVKQLMMLGWQMRDNMKKRQKVHNMKPQTAGGGKKYLFLRMKFQRWRHKKKTARVFLGKVELLCFLTLLARSCDLFSSLQSGSERGKHIRQKHMAAGAAF